MSKYACPSCDQPLGDDPVDCVLLANVDELGDAPISDYFCDFECLTAWITGEDAA